MEWAVRPRPVQLLGLWLATNATALIRGLPATTGRAGPTLAERFEDARHLLNKKSLCAAVRSGS